MYPPHRSPPPSEASGKADKSAPEIWWGAEQIALRIYESKINAPNDPRPYEERLQAARKKVYRDYEKARKARKAVKAAKPIFKADGELWMSSAEWEAWAAQGRSREDQEEPATEEE